MRVSFNIFYIFYLIFDLPVQITDLFLVTYAGLHFGRLNSTPASSLSSASTFECNLKIQPTTN